MSLPLKIALSALRRPAIHRYGPHPAQVGELFVPRGPGPFPVAVILHGGYWQDQYGKLVTRPLAVALARSGWAAWNVEYRRLGREGGGWPATFDDVACAVDHLSELADHRLNLDYVVAVGHSAGGQLALWAGARAGLPLDAPGAGPKVLLKQVVALAPVTDLGTAGASAVALMGGGPDEVPERWAQANPMDRIPLEVPVLLVHNRDDRTVSVHQSLAYAAAAEHAGASVVLIEHGTGGHRGLIDPSGETWEATLGIMEQARRAINEADGG